MLKRKGNIISFLFLPIDSLPHWRATHATQQMRLLLDIKIRKQLIISDEVTETRKKLLHGN